MYQTYYICAKSLKCHVSQGSKALQTFGIYVISLVHPIAACCCLVVKCHEKLFKLHYVVSKNISGEDILKMGEMKIFKNLYIYSYMAYLKILFGSFSSSACVKSDKSHGLEKK